MAFCVSWSQIALWKRPCLRTHHNRQNPVSRRLGLQHLLLKIYQNPNRSLTPRHPSLPRRHRLHKIHLNPNRPSDAQVPPTPQDLPEPESSSKSETSPISQTLPSFQDSSEPQRSPDAQTPSPPPDSPEPRTSSEPETPPSSQDLPEPQPASVSQKPPTAQKPLASQKRPTSQRPSKSQKPPKSSKSPSWTGVVGRVGQQLWQQASPVLLNAWNLIFQLVGQVLALIDSILSKSSFYGNVKSSFKSVRGLLAPLFNLLKFLWNKIVQPLWGQVLRLIRPRLPERLRSLSNPVLTVVILGPLLFLFWFISALTPPSVATKSPAPPPQVVPSPTVTPAPLVPQAPSAAERTKTGGLSPSHSSAN